MFDDERVTLDVLLLTLVQDDAIVMALFFGTIGLLYFSVLAPLAGTLALVGAPVIRRVTSRVLGLALVQGKRSSGNHRTVERKRCTIP